MADGDGGFGDDGPVVGVGWLRARLGEPGVRVVDARPAAFYAAGHIPGALQSDLYAPALKLPDSSPAAVARFDAAVEAELRRLGVRPGERVIFYEEIGGTSAARGVWLLDYAGIGGGALLDGGLIAWRAAGGGVVREVPAADPSDVRVRSDRSVLATAEELRDGLRDRGGAGPLLLDTRNDAEHAAGTIPGSVHLDWVEHLRPDGRLRSVTDLRARYAAAGVDPGDKQTVVAYCASGYRAAHAYVVLRALGHERVKNYAASWHEWGRRPDLPIEVPEDD